ncbi:MAG: S46 family peptidase [Flavobacteriales bacterium]|nr:S46 family peptidase [Flavobacteriales bacterium]
MRKPILTLLFVAFTLFGNAKEGMWIPALLKAVEGDMQSYGLKLTAEDIYSINQSSLKDAIVHFGGGCTAEVISTQGLILTNHHCGYGQIQSHSSLENDYLTDGFWAMSRSEELKNPGLTATFIVEIRDVTAAVLKGATLNMAEADRNKLIEENSAKLEGEVSTDSHYEAKVRPFYYGNEFYMIITETYEDVRLVGAPPSSIGKFGGDTDNWIWPRHTGDFSIFRIYAAKDGHPAEPSDDNVPLTPKHSLEINLDGVEEGDFTMVYGFPGRTEQYLSSYAVDYVMNKSNPARIEMRTASLGVIDDAMERSDKIRIQYAAKQSRISNAWKKWIGQNFGLNRLKALDEKVAFEKEFRAKVNEEGLRKEYGTVLNNMKGLYNEIEPYNLARDYFIEYVFYGPEFVRYANRFSSVVDQYDDIVANGKLDDELDKLKRATESHFKNYNRTVDQKIFEALTPIYKKGVQDNFEPNMLAAGLNAKFKGNVNYLGNVIYNKSLFVDQEKMDALLSNFSAGSIKKIAKDPAFRLMKDFFSGYYDKIRPKYNDLQSQINLNMRDYMRGLRELFPQKASWADANSTLRLTYGKAEGSEPLDAVIYRYYTTLDGAIAKYIPDSKDFDLPEKLIELWELGDYGQYAHDGEMRVCFTGSNHTSGGNSGSPCLNGFGQLVGLNFDRSWESTMSDIRFAPELCRNIMVDIRYVLFIVDKFAGATHLIDEMELVRNPQEVEPDPMADPVMQSLNR